MTNLERENWDIIDSFFRDNNDYLVKHHLDSYNDFIINKIPQTLKQYNPLTIYKDKISAGQYLHTVKIYFGGREGDKVYVSQPVVYDKIKEVKKHMYPNEARLKNLDYASHLFCDVEIEYSTVGEDIPVIKQFEKIELGRIPIMLKSKHCILHEQEKDTLVQMGECPYDLGGYFIIGGMEKVILSHERKVENKIYITKSNDDKYLYGAQIKSVPEEGFKYARTTSVYISTDDLSIDVIVSGFERPIPVFIIFRALGIITDKDILVNILYDLESDLSQYMLEILHASVTKSQVISTQNLALKFLSKMTKGRSVSYVIRTLLESIFPHVGNNFMKKAMYLGLIVRRLIMVNAGLIEPTDRDSYIYKRVDLSGFLMANLFRDSFKQFLRNCKIQIDTLYRFNTAYKTDISTIVSEGNKSIIFNVKQIEDPIFKSFKMGNLLGKKGLIQALSRVTSLSTIAHLRRVNTPNDLVMINQRRLHSTQYGIFDCVDSPDGSNIGIKKHLSIMSRITFGCSSKPIIDLLRENNLYFLDEILPQEVKNTTKVFVNGNWIGIHKNPTKLVERIRLLRRNALINIFTSVSWDRFLKEINIETDGGRVCRPFYIVKDNKILLTKSIAKSVKSSKYLWHHLLSGQADRKKEFDYYNCEYNCPSSILKRQEGTKKIDLTVTQGIIEYLDVEEISSSLVCFGIDKLNDKGATHKYTHSEIHTYLTYGASGFCIPFSNCNQLPRNVFSCGHSRQSVGVYTTNFRNRFDTFAHVNYYPQKPLVHTRLSSVVYEDIMPAGMNAIVAILCHSGYNQEDSIIINQSALDRGLFRTSYFRSYGDIELQDTGLGTSEGFYNPLRINEEVSLKAGYNYDKLDERGVVRENEYVTDKDIIIGKYAVNGDNIIDLSSSPNVGNYGRIDKVFYTNYNSDDHKICKIRISNERIPTFGDKFASRHGQKGTVGIVFRQEDMPFTKDGIVPDIIINPHAIPSRMTIGQLLECIMGKMCCVTGSLGDATPFENYDVASNISDMLETHCNFERHGNEILYNGRDGKQIDVSVFIGPTYYQRLKLMTKDKINSRATGSVTLKERQPPSGKSIGGGLRIGEMERDAILSHGLSQFLKESMMERADKYSIYVDNKTGRLAAVNPKNNIYISPSCDGPIEFSGDNVSNLKVIVKNKNCMDFTQVEVPYCFKLMMQECESMGMTMRIVTNKSEVEQKDYLNETTHRKIAPSKTPTPSKTEKTKKKRKSSRRSKPNQKDMEDLLLAISEDASKETREAMGPVDIVTHKYARYPEIKIDETIRRNDLVDLIDKITMDTANSSIEDIKIEFNVRKTSDVLFKFTEKVGELLTPNTMPTDIGYKLDSLLSNTEISFVNQNTEENDPGRTFVGTPTYYPALTPTPTMPTPTMLTPTPAPAPTMLTPTPAPTMLTPTPAPTEASNIKVIKLIGDPASASASAPAPAPEHTSGEVTLTTQELEQIDRRVEDINENPERSSSYIPVPSQSPPPQSGGNIKTIVIGSPSSHKPAPNNYIANLKKQEDGYKDYDLEVIEL